MGRKQMWDTLDKMEGRKDSSYANLQKERQRQGYSVKMNTKLKYSDAKYNKKKISSWVIELKYGTQRGGVIFIWKKATKEDVASAIRLPHIFSITPDKKFFLVDEVHFLNWNSAVSEYNDLKSVKDIFDLMRRNG